MTAIKSFAENIVILMIIISALINITGGSNYEKYIRFVASMLMAAYMLSSANTLIDYVLSYKDSSLSYDSDSLEDFVIARDELVNSSVEAYLENEIFNALLTSGYKIKKLECSYDGENYSINVMAGGDDLAGIKKYIIDFYHIDSEHINCYRYEADE